MQLWRAAFFIGLGGLFAQGQSVAHDPRWLILLAIAGQGWAWTAFGGTVRRAWNGLVAAITGRPQVLPTTDPKALAAEIAALNAQISQLRETATSFDVSFDHTLERLDERLRRVEQQSPYLPNTLGGGR